MIRSAVSISLILLGLAIAPTQSKADAGSLYYPSEGGIPKVTAAQ